MTPRFRGLVVHPLPEALGELVDLLASQDLDLDTARSATEARHKIDAERYALVITAHRSPELDGVALLEACAERLAGALRVVMVSDPSQAPDLDERPRSDAIIRFVGEPDQRSHLAALVGEGLKLLRLVGEQRRLVTAFHRERDKLRRRETLLDVVVRERTKELEDAYEQLKAANRQALFGLAEAIEAKDPYTKGHCGRVAGYALVLAEEAGYPASDRESLEFGAFLHDIGKIGVRDAVLQKPGPLDDEEWLHMREHPVMGYEIGSQIEMLKPVMSAVRNHHERWDGSGYPDRMRGEDIPPAARIVAIADAYDAMATERPYKSALPLEECDALLRKSAGVMFDPDLVEVFCRRRVGALYRADYEGLAPALSPDDAG